MKNNLDPKIAIILVNWNGWNDTIECIESLFKMSFSNFFIIVCDNNSHDESDIMIQKWAQGAICPYVESNNPLRHLIVPECNKPISILNITELNQSEIPEKQIYYIKTKKNIGFAAGNNVAIKFAMAVNDCKYIWLLNNDTVVEHETLQRLIGCYQENDQNIGIMGCMTKHYASPDIIQAIGGRYRPFWGISRHIAENQKDRNQYNEKFYIPDYINGSSMMVTKKFVQDVGLLSEDYFLYFEELDWAQRARKKNFTIATCLDAVVYHKGGASIGSSGNWKNRKIFAEYYAHRSRILFTKKFYPYFLVNIYIELFILMIICRNKEKRKIILKSIFNKKYQQ